MTARYTHEFRSDGEAPSSQDLVAQMFGTPTEQEAAQETDAFLAMFFEASLSPQQILQYLENVPWRARDAGEDALPSPDTDDGA